MNSEENVTWNFGEGTTLQQINSIKGKKNNLKISTTETYFRLTAPIIYRLNLTVPNWRRHKSTASNNGFERCLK